MKVRRYVARDMRSALSQVRAEQGPDVVILSNRKVEGGVEIITAEEYDEALQEQQTELVLERAMEVRVDEAEAVQPLPKSANKTVQPAPAAEAPVDAAKVQTKGSDSKSPTLLWTKDSLLDEMRAEIKALRGMLEQERPPIVEPLQQPEPVLISRLRARLSSVGFAAELTDSLLRQIPAEDDERGAWTRTMSMLCKTIPTARLDVCKQGGIFAFFGTTGVGKTSVIAKLAVRHALEFGPDAVDLITTDNKRFGAFEQLRTIGEMAGLTVWTVSTVQDMNRALAACQSKPLVLIDTAGLSFNRDPGQNPLAIFADCLGKVKPQLVLSATDQPALLQRIRRTFRALQPAGLVVTKLDEAVSLGPIISELVEQSIPLSYTCSGQRFPEDIEEARAHSLVSAAMAIAKQDSHSGSVKDDLPAHDAPMPA